MLKLYGIFTLVTALSCHCAQPHGDSVELVLGKGLGKGTQDNPFNGCVQPSVFFDHFGSCLKHS
eukprot:4655424-Amphidinium_carterae.1